MSQPQPADDGQLSVSEGAHLLQSARRRQALDLLARFGPLTKRELAERIASKEYGRSINGPGGYEKRQSVYIGLHQDHLPALVEIGAISSADTSEDMYQLEQRGQVLCNAMDSLEAALEEESA